MFVRLFPAVDLCHLQIKGFYQSAFDKQIEVLLIYAGVGDWLQDPQDVTCQFWGKCLLDWLVLLLDSSKEEWITFSCSMLVLSRLKLGWAVWYESSLITQNLSRIWFGHKICTPLSSTSLFLDGIPVLIQYWVKCIAWMLFYWFLQSAIWVACIANVRISIADSFVKLGLVALLHIILLCFLHHSKWPSISLMNSKQR